MKWLGVRVTLIILMLTVSACSSSTPPPPKPRVVPPIGNPVHLSVVWSDQLHASSAGSFVPTFDNNAIFTADSSGYIYRIDSSDGTIINKFNLNRELSSGTAVNADSIFVTTKDGYLLSVNRATGFVTWQAHLPTISIVAPQVSSNDIVVVRTNDAQLLAYKASTGQLLWLYQRNTPHLMLRAYDAFQVIGGEVVLVGGPSGMLSLVNVNTGTVIWENNIAEPTGATDIDKLTDIATRPIIRDRELCVATFNGKLACLDAIGSTIIWSQPFSTGYSPLMDIANVYAISWDGIAYAYNKDTGVELWKNDILQYRELSTPAFLSHYLLVVDSEGYINLFNCADGRLSARLKSDLLGGIAYPWTNGQKVVVQSANGMIAAITLL